MNVTLCIYKVGWVHHSPAHSPALSEQTVAAYIHSAFSKQTEKRLFPFLSMNRVCLKVEEYPSHSISSCLHFAPFTCSWSGRFCWRQRWEMNWLRKNSQPAVSERQWSFHRMCLCWLWRMLLQLTSFCRWTHVDVCGALPSLRKPSFAIILEFKRKPTRAPAHAYNYLTQAV